MSERVANITDLTYAEVAGTDLPQCLEGLFEVGGGLGLVVPLDGCAGQGTIGAGQEGQGLRVSGH